jgi:exodeoxyribonuclease V beta subunit
MLHDLLHAFDLPARLLARLDGERALTNLLHLAELLQHAAASLDGEHALIRHLATQIANAMDAQSETAEEQIVRLESEAELIKVITIHKSKGLEYPLVLLPFACSMREVDAKGSFVWHDEHGESRMDLAANDSAWIQAERERLQEDLRLLYVALTRARYACWLGIACYRVGNSKMPVLHKSAFGHVLSGGEVIQPQDLLPRLEALRGSHPGLHIQTLQAPATHPLKPTSDTVTPLWEARIYQGRPMERWWVASYSSLKYAESAEVRAPAPETANQDILIEVGGEQPAPSELAPAPAQGMHAFHAGAEAGTFLHDLLEWVADEEFADVSRDTVALEKEIARRCQRRGWQASIPLLSHWLPSLIRAPLPLPADRINGLLKGFIDLVAEYRGRYYVIDYKSNKLGTDASAYTPEAMRDSVLRERYDLQYAIYTLALHRQLRARLPGYDYERHMGGVAYLYLRGIDGASGGVHGERLPYALIDAMDRLFAEGDRAHAA